MHGSLKLKRRPAYFVTESLLTFRRLLMQHPNKKLTDMKRLRRLYEDGAVFTAFDTETTGITPTNSRIIEIGAVRFTNLTPCYGRFEDNTVYIPPYGFTIINAVFVE